MEELSQHFTSIFLDSGFFIALGNESDRDHKHAKALSDKMRKGEFGQPFTSDYVFDESITATLVRTGRLDRAVSIGKLILGDEEKEVSPIARLVYVNESTFSRAWDNFFREKYRKKALSFTDHTILVQTKDLGIDAIASMDSGFDGLIQRVF